MSPMSVEPDGVRADRLFAEVQRCRKQLAAATNSLTVSQEALRLHIERLAAARKEADVLDHIIRTTFVGRIWNAAWSWDEIAELRADYLALLDKP